MNYYNSRSAWKKWGWFQIETTKEANYTVRESLKKIKAEIGTVENPERQHHNRNKKPKV